MISLSFSKRRSNSSSSPFGMLMDPGMCCSRNASSPRTLTSAKPDRGSSLSGCSLFRRSRSSSFVSVSKSVSAMARSFSGLGIYPTVVLQSSCHAPSVAAFAAGCACGRFGALSVRRARASLKTLQSARQSLQLTAVMRSWILPLPGTRSWHATCTISSPGFVMPSGCAGRQKPAGKVREVTTMSERPSLAGKKIAFLATDGVEQVELTRPWKEVKEAGGDAELVSPKSGRIQGFRHLDKGDTFDVDRQVGDARAEDYDALVLPGGVANPDSLRLDKDSVQFTREFFRLGKPIAAICHGPWVLVEAAVVDGRKLTSWPSLQTDIRNAGGRWVDEEVVTDDGLITSRKPDDLDAFCHALLEQLAPAEHKEAG